MRSAPLLLAVLLTATAVRGEEPIAPERKLARSAVREAVSGRTFARLNVVFRGDVSFEDAQHAILAAGGAVDRPFKTAFDRPRNIRAHVPAFMVGQLAADDRVFTIYGPPARVASDNLAAAQTAHVDVVQSSAYGLDGSGITLSYFELSPGDASHVEFGGRLILHFAEGWSKSDTAHATHTGGTLIAKGINPQAKGIAPAATLHGYGVDNGGEWLNLKFDTLPTIHSTADNNSWGYILGWCGALCGSANGWLWTGNDEYIGGYDSTDSAIDEIARLNNTLMVHSAGNTGDATGPTQAPFAHDHTDENGNTIEGETFCYSSNGSGTDCPPPCSAGVAHCEVLHHPVHASVGSIGLTASSKNVIAVGATDTQRNIQAFSSRGPTRDGRVKPDLTAKGLNTFSTFPNNNYASLPGTSMAAPVVTGIAGLLTQQWRKTYVIGDPLPATLKALLIAGAVDAGNPGPDYANGFGAVDAKRSVDLIIADGGTGKRIAIRALAQNGSIDFPLTLTSRSDLRVVLVWTDPEVLLFGDDLAGPTLVNDLDVVVKGPAGDVLPYVLDPNAPNAEATRGVNTRDNVEEIEISKADAGTYHVVVTGKRIAAQSPQQFVVVVTAGTLSAPAAPDRRRSARH